MRVIERYFYAPNFWQKVLAVMLFPLSLFYCCIATLRRRLAKYEDFGIPIISVGNLTLGGSGKTPFVLELIKEYPDSCVILRGYGRKSRGLEIVSHNGKIFKDSKIAGDEALMLAKTLKNSLIIVCEDRKKEIIEA